MADLYIQLSYDEYKALEEQLRDFEQRESMHVSMSDDHRQFYHKSLSFRVAGIRFEFHGPNVKAPDAPPTQADA